MDSVLWTILGASITVVVAILNWATSKPEKWDTRLYQYTLLLAAVFTAYGSWRAFLLSEEKTWRQEDVQFQNDFLQKKQNRERVKYERDLRSKAEEIAALNRTIAGSVTGGDSYVYMLFSLLSKSNDSMLTLAHRGKFPVFDVSIEMFDLDETENRKRELGLKDDAAFISLQHALEITKPKLKFNFQIVRPNMSLRLVDSWKLPADKNVARYRFSIFTRNGILSQVINLRRVNDSWTQASQVLKRTDPKKQSVLLYEWTDPDFPRNKQGKVVW